MILKSPLTFPTQQKYKAANETLEGIEMSVGLDARDHLAEDETTNPSCCRVTRSGCLTMRSIRSLVYCLMKVRSSLSEIGGDHIGGEDARPSSAKGKGDGHAKDDEEVVKSDLPHVSAGLPGDGITYVNDDGKEVKIDKAGRPYSGGLVVFINAEWAMMRKYYTEEEKAEVKGGGKKKKEEPKSKGSEISTPAEAQTLQMPGAKRLRNRWGGIDWQYNWGLRKNVSKIKNPQDGKHLAELDWVRIIVNPVDGVVILMDSKKSQDVLRQSVQLEKEYGCLVVIYAWKFISEERARPTPNWTKAVASIIARHEDEAELLSGPDPTDDMPTDFTWYEWEESAEVVSGKVPLALSAIGEEGNAKKYPSMPCVTSELIQHREKAVKVVRFFDALVSRPVGRKEMLTNPDALASMKKEWSGLIDQVVFDLDAVREYDAVAKEAKAKGEEVHMARAHGICVEKHSQLPVGDPKRKFKGRGVLLGNQVKNQSFEAAMFQDLGNSPASFEASRWADFLGCHDGWDVQMADAVQAYIQATLRGTPCWIELPPEAVPSECNWGKYRRPVVALGKALYGHPDAGTFWEQHCDESVRAVGFEPIGEEWPSVYIHEKLQLVLVVYVDDFKMAGPQKNLAQGWSMLRTRLKIEPETGLDMYLGCNQSKGTVTLGNGHRVTTVTYDMEHRYLEVAGDVKLNKVVTSGTHEETKDHVSRRPAKEGPSVVCNWCNNLVPTDGSALKPDQREGTPELAMKEPVRGHLAPHAASVLMKLLYGARIARFDLLRQVNRLARNVHRWTDSDDRGLHHLMCCVHHTKHWRMVGWVGDPMDDVHLALYADADFAGCVESLRSTSGGHLNLQGPNTRFPLSGSSKRQSC